MVCPEDDTAANVAQSLVSDYVVDYFTISHDLSVVRLKAPRSFVGQTLRELALRPKYNVSVVAIDQSPATGSGSHDHQAGPLVVNMPGSDAMVQADDLLVVLGDADALKRLQRAIG